MANAEDALQLLRCPETITQLCDIIIKGATDIGIYAPIKYNDVKFSCESVAVLAATEGRSISMEVWAAGMWAVASLSEGGGEFLAQKVLATILPEVLAHICSSYASEYETAESQLLEIAYMICPKESPVAAIILFELPQCENDTYDDHITIKVKFSPTDDSKTLTLRDLLEMIYCDPIAPSRIRASAAYNRAILRDEGSDYNIELLCRSFDLDPTCYRPYVTLVCTVIRVDAERVVSIGGRSLNVWGLYLEAITHCSAGARWRLYAVMRNRVPTLDGTVISLGDSSMPVFDYICALESPTGSGFFPAMLTDMLPADTPWSCRRHEALDRRTGANALFATFLCALARLEGPGGPLRPSHQTMWEHALESWTLGDSAGMCG